MEVLTTNKVKRFYKFSDIKQDLKEHFKEFTQTRDKQALLQAALDTGHSFVVSDFKTILNTDTLPAELLEEVRSLFDLKGRGHKVYTHIHERTVLNIISFIVDITARIKLRTAVKHKEQRHTALVLKHKISIYNHFIFLVSNQNRYLFEALVLRSHRHLLTYSAYKNRTFYKALQTNYKEQSKHLSKLDTYCFIDSIKPVLTPTEIIENEVKQDLNEFKEQFFGDNFTSPKAKGKRTGLISSAKSQAYRYLISLIIKEKDLYITNQNLLDNLKYNFVSGLSMQTINDFLGTLKLNTDNKVNGFTFTDQVRFEILSYITDAVEIMTSLSNDTEDEQVRLFEEFKLLYKRIEIFNDFKRVYIFKKNIELLVIELKNKADEINQSLALNVNKIIEKDFKFLYKKIEKELKL